MAELVTLGIEDLTLHLRTAEDIGGLWRAKESRR